MICFFAFLAITMSTMIIAEKAGICLGRSDAGSY